MVQGVYNVPGIAYMMKVMNDIQLTKLTSPSPHRILSMCTKTTMLLSSSSNSGLEPMDNLEDLASQLSLRSKMDSNKDGTLATKPNRTVGNTIPIGK